VEVEKENRPRHNGSGKRYKNKQTPIPHQARVGEEEEMRTEKGWPSQADSGPEKGCLVFKGGGETTTTYFDSFEEAVAVFLGLYNEYPGIVWRGDCWKPDLNHRCSVPHKPWGSNGGRWYNPEYGREVILYYKDGRREGWQSPCCDKTGRFYRGAFVRQTMPHIVPGYGYMQRRKPRRDDLLPAGTARSDWAYKNPDPVNIGGVIVDQREINRIRESTGALPTHITTWDASGSYLYLEEIVWGDEPQLMFETAVRQ
jgi:hypothetical protein